MKNFIARISIFVFILIGLPFIASASVVYTNATLFGTVNIGDGPSSQTISDVNATAINFTGQRVLSVRISAEKASTGGGASFDFSINGCSSQTYLWGQYPTVGASGSGYHDIALPYTCTLPVGHAIINTNANIKIGALSPNNVVWIALYDSLYGNLDHRTRLENFTPSGVATTSNPVNINFDYYINSADISNPLTLVHPPFNGVHYPNICVDIQSQNYLPALTTGCVSSNLDSYSHFSFASTSLQNGQNQAIVYLYNSVTGEKKFPFGQDGINYFAVNNYSAIGYDSSFASGTVPILDVTTLGRVCNPISNNISTLYLNPNFSIIECTALFFLPNPTYISQSFSTFKDQVLYAFPVGYITDFVSIMATTSTSSLTVVDATLPMFGNPHISLNLSHSIDYILNATTSSFTNSSASSTETLGVITKRYWDIILYILALFYIVRRVLGKSIIPHFNYTKK